MAKLTPSEYREKHARRLKGATTDIQRGVERVTDSPMEKAAAKQDKMREGIVKAIDTGKWARGLKRVSLEDWKNKMVNVGVGRIAAGIDAAADKVEAFAAELLPHIDSGRDKIKRMPDVTLDDSINRMVEFTRHMANFERRS